MRARLAFFLFALILSASAARAADGPVVMAADTCFTNMAPRGGVFPVVVSLRNAGPSVDGTIVIRTDSFSDALRSYVYPISLPTGAQKQVVVYPVLNNYAAQITVSFNGPARVRDVVVPASGHDGTQVGVIGDDVGALSLLRRPGSVRAKQQGAIPSGPPGYGGPGPDRFNDCYARPEDAPDRAAGYGGLSTLVLTDGAERMRPEQWSAIRRWVLDGGSLVLTGGAGASFLRLPDASSLVPLASLQETTLPLLSLPSDAAGGSSWPGPAAGLNGTPLPGATVLATENGVPLVTRQAYGAGTVLLLSFNPFDKPVRGSAGARILWTSVIGLASPSLSGPALRAWTARQAVFDSQRAYSYIKPYRSGGRYIYPPPHAASLNPFRISLPPVSTVAWIFLAYFVLVIPVTYFVLKRLGRLEWAWVTSPLISVAFAYVFYLFTSQLYGAGLSRRTAGVVVSASGSPDAQFDGFSELFIPRGGTYPLGVAGAEALELSAFGLGNEEEYAYRGSNTNLQSLETVDEGDARVPNFAVGNLAFRRVYHTEEVSLGGAVTASLARNERGDLTGTVHNGTRFSLSGCGLYFAGRTGSGPRRGALYVSVGDLAPGQSQTLIPGRMQGGEDTPFAEMPMRMLEKWDKSRAYFVGRTAGAEFGPAIGRDVGGTNSIAVLVSVPVGGTL